MTSKQHMQNMAAVKHQHTSTRKLRTKKHNRLQVNCCFTVWTESSVKWSSMERLSIMSYNVAISLFNYVYVWRHQLSVGQLCRTVSKEFHNHSSCHRCRSAAWATWTASTAAFVNSTDGLVDWLRSFLNLAQTDAHWYTDFLTKV